LPPDRKIPLLAIGSGKIDRPAVDVQELAAEYATGKANRRKTVDRPECRCRVDLVTEVAEACRERWIECRIVIARIL
jgi:hypothetical protein